MKVKVEKSGCISCGLCVSTCDAFIMGEDEKAEAIFEDVPPEYEQGVQEAAQNCPVMVIEVF